HPKDPTVSRQEPPVVERVDLEVVVVAARAGVVAADRDPHRTSVVAVQPEVLGRAGRGTVTREHHRRAVGDAALLWSGCRRDAGDPPGAVDHQIGDGGVLTQVGAGFHRAGSEQRVEVGARRTAPCHGKLVSSGQGRSSCMPPAMTRTPLLCCQPASSLTSMPMSTRARVPRGVSPSPHTFSRGKVAFSRSRTSSPALASQYVALLPAGPAPTTMASWASELD